MNQACHVLCVALNSCSRCEEFLLCFCFVVVCILFLRCAKRGSILCLTEIFWVLQRLAVERRLPSLYPSWNLSKNLALSLETVIVTLGLHEKHC